MGDISLRTARPEDARQLWRWRNEGDVRARAFNQELVPWEGHREWYEAKLADPAAYLFIADMEDKPVGQIRFDIGLDAEAVVSVSVDGAYRGQGLGTKLIRAGTLRLYEISHAKSVRAYVKADNQASARAFEKAGYEHVGVRRVDSGEEAVMLRHVTGSASTER